jgi:acetyltransferase-like isoleucine patch superfamily enzyme
MTALRKRAVTQDEQGRAPPNVHLGRGTLVEDDVRLGDAATSAKGLDIGKDAIIRSGAELHDGVRIGDRLDLGRNVVIGKDTVIGDGCRIGNNTIIEADCAIGDRVRINANCYIARFTTIGDDVTICAGVCLANDPHPGSENHLCERGPTIERGAQLGMNATILPFVTVGERSLVAAGSVVTHSVPAEVVVAGNPARVVKSIAEISCPLDLHGGDYLKADEG